MTARLEKIVHYVVLIAITIVAVAVMWKLSAKQQMTLISEDTTLRPLSPVAAQKAPVAIQPLQVEMCEITSTYAGKIQPWESYQIGFEVGGRVIALGTNAAGKELDEGDRVQQGQILAMLDDRVFRAQKSEAAARIEQATSELRRAEQVRARQPNALTDSEFQKLATDLALAKAQYEVTLKNLDDATLRAPVNATISKRMIKSGESVNPNQLVFELVQNDEVLLIVDVPETHIRELEQRKRTIAANRMQPAGTTPIEPVTVFRAHVHLEGRDRFDNPWPTIDGEVYHIPEISDQRTGLFPVEIRINNQERLLRPGMVATADIVTANLYGYKVPEVAVLVRKRNAHLFSVTREQASMEMLYWNVGNTYLYRAHHIPLARWIDQGEFIFVPAEEAEIGAVVTRGQYRLADGQLLRVMNLNDFSPGEVQFGLPNARVDVAKDFQPTN